MTNSGVGGRGAGTRIAGHVGRRGREVPHWDQPLPAAGGVESTIDDMARYAQAQFGRPATGMGWRRTNERYLFHNGGTGGFSSTALVAQHDRRAVVILASSGGATNALDAAALRAISWTF